jgi:hypothetical protein
VNNALSFLLVIGWSLLAVFGVAAALKRENGLQKFIAPSAALLLAAGFFRSGSPMTVRVISAVASSVLVVAIIVTRLKRRTHSQRIG